MGTEMLERLKSETKTDEVSSKLREVYQQGWPAHKKQLDRDLMSYWPIKDTIRICDGVIMTNDKFIIPTSMRSVILDRLHEAHQGIQRTKEHARRYLYRPGMSAEIQSMIERCTVC